MKKLTRKILLNWARKIANREGLTLCDIRNISGADYIVDMDNTFHKISRSAEKIPYKFEVVK
jgi:hypothetical protein